MTADLRQAGLSRIRRLIKRLYARSVHAEAYIFAVVSYLESLHVTGGDSVPRYKEYQEVAVKLNVEFGYGLGKIDPGLRELNLALTQLAKELGEGFRPAIEAEIRRVSPNVMDDK